MATDTWLQEIRERQAEIRARHRRIASAAARAADEVIQKSGEDPVIRTMLLGDVSRLLVRRARKRSPRPKNPRNLFEHGVSPDWAAIHLSAPAGDIDVQGWLVEAEGRYVTLRIPQKYVRGWIVRGRASYARKPREV